MIETGTILQLRYKIDKQIGQGGMGAVYVATDERFGSTVAIKETLCMDDNFRKAIEREARLLNSLKHTSLPRVSDHFEESDGLFLVMEYIPGEDVAAMIENDHASFTVDQILKWADQLLDALDYLHNQEIPVIHRDIKPQNLKINSRGEMILLDFGLAKGNPTDASHQTAAKSIFGYSRNYASLEQIQGTGTDPRSDLYSLAATLYHMLADVPPTDALTRAMSVLSKKPDPLHPVNTVNPVVPLGVAGVLQKALDLDAGERPSSASEMKSMLHEHQNYAYLALAATVDGRLTGANAAGGTQVGSENTVPDSIKSIDAKTEVLPREKTQATGFRSDASEAQTVLAGANATYVGRQKSNSLSMAAGAFIMLLVGSVIAGGIYFVKPSVFSLGNIEEKSVDPVTNLPVRADGNSSVNPIDAPPMPGSGTSASNLDGSQIATESSKPADKHSPTDKNKTTGAPKIDSEKELGEIVDVHVNDPNIPPEGIFLTERDENGKITTMRVNRVRPPANSELPPPPDRMNPFPMGVDIRKLSPEQRRKLQRILKNNMPMNKPPPRKPEN